MNAPEQPSDWAQLLRQGDDSIFERLYVQYYRASTAFVKANSGNEQDARDVFQEALIVLFKKSRTPNFQLTTSPGAYLHAVVRNLWLYRLRTRQAHPEISVQDHLILPETGDDDWELLLGEQNLEEKHRVVKLLLESLKTECQKLIEYAYYYQYSTAEMARLLDYAESFIKVKKHRCMEALREKVKNHPAFNDEK